MAKLFIEKVNLSDNVFKARFGNYRHYWDVTKLIQYCKEKEYPVIKIHVCAIDISVDVWDVCNVFEFIEHSKRVKEVDKSIPILLDSFGFICDGWHRYVRAVLDGDEYIDAIRIDKMPSPSKIEEIEK